MKLVNVRYVTCDETDEDVTLKSMYQFSGFVASRCSRGRQS